MSAGYAPLDIAGSVRRDGASQTNLGRRLNGRLLDGLGLECRAWLDDGLKRRFGHRFGHYVAPISNNGNPIRDPADFLHSVRHIDDRRV